MLIQERVRNYKTAFIAKRACSKMKGLRSDWDTYRIEAMRNGIKAKFDQNSACKTKLIATFPHELVEHSPYDKFWGDGHSNGLNWLGKLLVELRKQYIEEEKNKILNIDNP